MNYFIPDTNSLYGLVEAARHNLSHSRLGIMAMHEWLEKATHPFAKTHLASVMKATLDISERMTRTYKKPSFGITKCMVDGKEQEIHEHTLCEDVFCHLQHFEKPEYKKYQPKLLIVAPMSGHHATLLRGTVQDTLPFFDVYITDWVDANQVPITSGSFDLDSFIDYVINYIRYLGPNVHVLAVCQPTVPVLVATSLMSQNNDIHVPNSMILIGGPIDARKNQTKPGDFAEDKSLVWFDQTVITNVPSNYPGHRRRVYPGFLQLAGFISMNLQRHVDSHVDLFKHLINGDNEQIDKQKKFYDEYLSVMDLPAEFYLQTIKEVFHEFSLAKDKFISRGREVHLESITQSALMGIEGENDDIAAVGQTRAALSLCKNIPASKKKYHLQKGVGHYGAFTGSKFRQEIVPAIKDFVYANDQKV
jgi:poly(3-hydroxybutyrate) depolymerase